MRISKGPYNKNKRAGSNPRPVKKGVIRARTPQDTQTGIH